MVESRMRLNNLLERNGTLNNMKYVEVVAGPKHQQTWTIIVLYDGEECGRGTGASKKAARGAAAAQALPVLQSRLGF
ncbi:hypothetical protein WOLCODRAFT_138712 [Wolfiporia cocos MD-104 SS10]|uniref:DRBM domain-containing protein n=1 Tax=Wolfiporia cocos (strain MD-104) TaxID=742152 RepID=A0A2H3K1H4_WOLCO|nr:hypothetical protein WOLCODRAFT_138712 [Wolfiporia cocos MD-104 SS10]